MPESEFGRNRVALGKQIGGVDGGPGARCERGQQDADRPLADDQHCLVRLKIEHLHALEAGIHRLDEGGLVERDPIWNPDDAAVAALNAAGYIGGDVSDLAGGTSGGGPTADASGSGTASGAGIKVIGDAYIFVSDTSVDILRYYQAQWGVNRDINTSSKTFASDHYKVHIYRKATQGEIISALANAKAVLFIGHNSGAKGTFSFATADGEYITPFDIATAMNGGRPISTVQAAISRHHLDYAIFHCCHSNVEDLKDATVGNGKGEFYGPTDYWNPVRNVETSWGF